MSTQIPEIHYCDARDSKPIESGGDTSFTEVFLSVRDGPADSLWQMVRNSVDVKPFQLNSSGAKTVTMENLVLGMNLFQLREHSSALPVSQWVVNVKEATVDTTIDSMHGYPGGVQLFNGGETLDPGVTLTGTAAASSIVDVYNGAAIIGQTTANPSGSWTLVLPNLPFAVYRFTAKVGSGQSSTPVWVLNKNYLEDFESFQSLSMGVGGSVGNAFLDIVYVSGPPGSAVGITQAVPVEGAITGQSLQPSYPNESPYSGLVVIDIRLKAPCSRVRFWSGAVSAPASVEFYNAVGALLGTLPIPHIPVGSILYLTDFSAAGISRISLKTTGGDRCNFDTFTFRP